jgi:hypothetical protein
VRARSSGSHPFAPGFHRRRIDTVNFVLDSTRITVAALVIATAVTVSIMWG